MNQEVLQKQKELELAFEQERLKYRNEINTIKVNHFFYYFNNLFH